jgi:histidine ammonia-lyase
MGTNSALIAGHVIENSFQVIAIHCIALAQAVDYLKIETKIAPATRQFYQKIREIIPVFKEDNAKYQGIAKIVKFLKNEEIDHIY